jgi:hypothetical protein
MSQHDKDKQSNNYPRVKIFNDLSKQIKCLNMDKNQTHKKKKKKKISSILIHRRIILVIIATTGWMMVLEALSDV